MTPEQVREQAAIEAIARALAKDAGRDPNYQIGVDHQGYHQQPFVGSVPYWKWYFERAAGAALAAIRSMQLPDLPGRGDVETRELLAIFDEAYSRYVGCDDHEIVLGQDAKHPLRVGDLLRTAQALSALLPGGDVPDGWQPRGTAPKGGLEPLLLLTNTSVIWTGHWSRQRECFVDITGGPLVVTHWMRLPPLPASTSSEKGGG